MRKSIGKARFHSTKRNDLYRLALARGPSPPNPIGVNLRSKAYSYVLFGQRQAVAVALIIA